ncbi:Alpha-amylase/subtilisin inhibitor [Spatholobus suberectus]|nr:Alpha-amylase/subtilisin inhibitor [Spatholobus suberectus]
MSMKLFASLNLAVWLFTATSSLAQSNNPYVLDTNGEPLESDDEYYIMLVIMDNEGHFTLINRNGSCPLYVGLENTDLLRGYSVKFTPFANNDDEVRVNRDLRVAFQASSTCVQSTEWRLGQNDTRSGRRLIITSRDDSRDYMLHNPSRF